MDQNTFTRITNLHQYLARTQSLIAQIEEVKDITITTRHGALTRTPIEISYNLNTNLGKRLLAHLKDNERALRTEFEAL